MSYTITIGKAVVHVRDADEGIVEVAAEGQTNATAPKFPGDDMTGQSNARHPAYGAWHSFVEVVRLKEFFHNEEEGLMRTHPGVFLLKEEHLATVKEARFKHEAGRTKALEPGWGEGLDPVQARLLWLEFWMDWALRNYGTPVIANY